MNMGQNVRKVQVSKNARTRRLHVRRLVIHDDFAEGL